MRARLAPAPATTHAVGQCDQRPAGARPRRHVRPRTSSSDGAHASPPPVAPSRPAVGSSSSSSGASRRNARARAMRWRSPAEQPGAALAQLGLDAVGQRARPRPPGERRRARATRPRARRPGGRRARCRRSSRRTGAGVAAPTRGGRARPRGRARAHRSPPTRTLPAAGVTRPSSTRNNVVLPGAARAGEREHLAGPHGQRERRRAQAAPGRRCAGRSPRAHAWRGRARRCACPRAGAGASSTSRICAAAAAPSAPAR